MCVLCVLGSLDCFQLLPNWYSIVVVTTTAAAAVFYPFLVLLLMDERSPATTDLFVSFFRVSVGE